MKENKTLEKLIEKYIIKYEDKERVFIFRYCLGVTDDKPMIQGSIKGKGYQDALEWEQDLKVHEMDYDLDEFIDQIEICLPPREDMINYIKSMDSLERQRKRKSEKIYPMGVPIVYTKTSRKKKTLLQKIKHL